MALAVSGGADSLALCALAAPRLAASGREGRALVVDHRLQPGSAAIAARAAAAARDFGLKTRVLTAPPQPSASEAAARAVRHRLLACACAEAGVRLLMLGHTLDDHLETVAMRLGRGSGPRGLAGLRAAAPSPAWPWGHDLVLARPLLGLTRAAVREGLTARGARWWDDPHNASARYERVRVRQRLAERPGGRAGLSRLAARARAVADRDARDARALLTDMQVNADGAVTVARGRLIAAAKRPRARAIAALIAATSGGEPPSVGRSQALAVALAGDAEGSRTHAGAHIRWSQGAAVFARDPGAMAGRVDRPGRAGWTKAGSRSIFDARLVVEDDGRLRALAWRRVARLLLHGEPAPWCDDTAAKRALGVCNPLTHVA